MPAARRKRRKPPKNPSKTTKAAPKKGARNEDPLAPARVSKILERLDQRYPDVTCALKHQSAWELLVATILSAQCTDVTVNKVTPTLFKKYPTPQDLAAIEPEQLEPDIRPTGFFRNKAKSVVAAAKAVMEYFNLHVPSVHNHIITLPHAAHKDTKP